MGVKLKHPLHHRDQDCIRRVKEVAMLTAFLPTQTSVAPCREVFPEPRVVPDRKESPRVISSFTPSIVSHFVEALLWLCPVGTAGESVRLDYWESHHDREGGKG